MLIIFYLKQTPHRIEIAENGAAGLDKFKRKKYDLVLMDMQMPVMDGLEATRAMRAWEQERGLAATPIVALTAGAFKDDEEKSRAAGCSSYLTKPIKKQTLLGIIESCAGGNQKA